MNRVSERFDLRISALYGITAVLWIIFSDRALALLFAQNAEGLAELSLAKGLAFVAVTTIALFLLVRAEMRKRERIERALQEELSERTRTMEALRQSESRFSTIFHASPVPTGIASAATGQVVDVNDAFVKLVGYERDELIGRKTGELGFWADSEIRADAINVLVEGKQARNVETLGRTKSGKMIHLLVSVDMIDLGDQPHVVGMLYDITERKRMEEQARYQALLLANASDAIISTDTNFVIQSWNPAAEAIYGWKADEVVGKVVDDVVRGEFPYTTVEEALQQLLTQGSWRGETLHRRKDGSIVHLLASTSCVSDSAGNKVGIVSVNRDISERKQMEIALRESEARFRNMADSAPAMLWTSAPNGDITFPSRGWLTFTGQSEDDARGWGWMRVVHPDDQEPLRNAFLAAIEQRSSFQLEYRLRRQSDGEFRTVIATGSPRMSESGEFLGYVGSVIDVSDYRKAQAEMQSAELMRVELEKEKELIQLKERFISVVSHEFRTPLSVIVSSTELIHDFYDRMPRERQLTHLKTILTQSEFMVGLLDDVLMVNKAKAGKLEFKPAPLDLKSFCQATVERIVAIDKGRHSIDLRYNCTLPEVQLDVKLLQHILINLLSNAAKYSPERSEVYLEVQCQDDDVLFTVRDQGIGIPKESLHRLFEPFHRAGNTGDVSGTGLGLTIVKESVDLHGGTISCESAVGMGTTFAVRLPASAATSA